MGHQSHVGHVTTQAFGQAVMFRIDSPQVPEREETLMDERWSGRGYWPKGAVVKHSEIPANTVIVGAGSIYRIIPCTEQVGAIQAIIKGQVEPLALVSLPPNAQIESAEEENGTDEYEEDGEE